MNIEPDHGSVPDNPTDCIAELTSAAPLDLYCVATGPEGRLKPDPAVHPRGERGGVGRHRQPVDHGRTLLVSVGLDPTASGDGKHEQYRGRKDNGPEWAIAQHDVVRNSTLSSGK